MKAKTKLKTLVPALAVPAGCDVALFNELTAREQAFVLHPEVMTDPVKAATDVGYAISTAQHRANQWRKELMYFIQPVLSQRLVASGVSLDRVQDELAAVAFAVETDYYESMDVDGDTIKSARDPLRLPERMRRAIKSLNIQNIVGTGGNVFQTLSVQLHDKLPALKMLAEMLGGFDPKNRVPGDTEARKRQAELFDYMTAEELKSVSVIYAAAEKRRAEAISNKVADKEAIEGET